MKTLITFWLGRHKEVNLRQKRKWPHSDENNTICQRTKWAGHSNLGKQGGAGRQAPALHKVLEALGPLPSEMKSPLLWPSSSWGDWAHWGRAITASSRASGSDKCVPAAFSLILIVQIVLSQSLPEYCWPCGNHMCCVLSLLILSLDWIFDEKAITVF